MKIGQTQRSQVIWYELSEEQGTKSAVERSSQGCIMKMILYRENKSCFGFWGTEELLLRVTTGMTCPQPLWDLPPGPRRWVCQVMGEWILRASLHSACYLCPLSGGPSACGIAHIFAILLGKRMASFEMGLEIRRFDLCTVICKTSSVNHFAFLQFFFLEMVLITASCTMSWTAIHSFQVLSLLDIIPWIYLSLLLYNR